MAEVRGVVGGDAADVHPGRTLRPGGDHLAACGVVQLRGSGRARAGSAAGGRARRARSEPRSATTTAPGTAAGARGLEGSMELDEYLPALQRVDARFAEVAAAAVLARGWAAPVPGCPGWRLADLVWHLAGGAALLGLGGAHPRAGPVGLPRAGPAPGRRAAGLARGPLRGAGDGARRAPTPPSRCGRGRRSTTSPSSLRRQLHEAVVHTVDAEQVARRRPPRARRTSGWTGSTSSSRSWCPGRCRRDRRRARTPSSSHAVDVPRRAHALPRHPAGAGGPADRHGRRPDADRVAAAARRGADRGGRRPAGRGDDRPGATGVRTRAQSRSWAISAARS